MKRAWILMIAVLAVLLVYPATMPSAKSPGKSDSPTISVITPVPNPSNRGSGQSGEDDEGDGDDLAGIRRGTRPTGGPNGGLTSSIPGESAVKVWWMYYFSYARIMF